MFLKELFHILNEKGVQYVIVGGLAMVMHGIVRLTADVDLVVSLQRDNILRFLDTMKLLGYKPRLPVKAEGLLEPETRLKWLMERNMKVFSFYNPKKPFVILDVFIDNPIDYSDLRERAQKMEFEGVEVYVAAIEDLIRLKELSDRPQDREDIKALRRLVNEKRPER
ncbi:MAG: hypothetical protein D6778_00495 [Nitrospirae bacterium]|nr:MAG: hypothetical protein D6778_00495 [Nitrospirota bacterium]